MIIKKLHLKGFTSYIDSKIEFNTNEQFISTIIAPNGYGKSSILEAITTALFYRARGVDNRGTGMDDLINKNCNMFEITFEFIMNNVEYKIIRRKTRKGKHELEFFIDNIPQTEKINETQEKIDNVIKMDYETFLDTICISQGKSGNFMNKKPNERKDVFIEILNLNQYENLEKYTKEIKKELSSQLSDYKNKLDLLSQDLNNENLYKDNLFNNTNKHNAILIKLNNLKDEFEKVQKEKFEYEELYKQSKQLRDNEQYVQHKLNNYNDKISNLKNKFTNTKNKILQLKKDLTNKQIELDLIVIDDIETFNRKKIEKNNEIEDILKQKEQQDKIKLEYENKIHWGEIEKNKLQQQYNRLNDYNEGICELCGSNITVEHKQQNLQIILNKINDINQNIQDVKNSKEIIDTKIQKIKEKYNISKKDLLDIESNISTINKNINQKEKLTLAIDNIKTNILNYNDILKEIKSNKKQIDEEKIVIEKELQAIQKKLKCMQVVQEKTFNDEDLKIKIMALENEEKEILASNAVYKERLNNIKISKQKCDKLKKEIDKIDLKIQDYDSLITAFSKKGIQADIIANVLPDIENEINEILKILFNSSINIEFITQKDNKKLTNTMETLDIIIHDKTDDRTYETYSGGEKFRIDFACHIGLSKFLSKRAKSNIEFFMIDEGLGSQDDEGKENFIITVNKLSSMFKQIFIITHIEELKDVFDKKIVITKDQIKGSQIKVI